jgi:hypothetical protein
MPAEQGIGTHAAKMSPAAVTRFDFCVGFCVRIRLVRKLAECLDGVDVTQYRAGDVLDLASREAEMLLAEGWASRTADPADGPESSKKPVEETPSPPEAPQSKSLRQYIRRTEDQVRELPASRTTTVRENRQTRRDDRHSACDTVQRILRKHDPETIQEQLRQAAATLSRKGASKGGQARAAKLSAKERSEIAKRAAAARWRKPR